MRKLFYIAIFGCFVASCSKQQQVEENLEKLTDGNIMIVYPSQGSVYRSGQTLCYRADFEADKIRTATASLVHAETGELLLNIEANPDTRLFSFDEEWKVPGQIKGPIKIEFSLTNQEGKRIRNSLLVSVDSSN